MAVNVANKTSLRDPSSGSRWKLKPQLSVREYHLVPVMVDSEQGPDQNLPSVYIPKRETTEIRGRSQSVYS